jgi:hypothetical protein
MITHYEPIDDETQREFASAYSSASPELTDVTASDVRATLVRVTPIPVAAQEAASPERSSPAATAVVARTANRRRDVRTRVSFTACIRQVGTTGEEIVECDNISKGGFSFRGRKAYAENSAIEVAVPYSPGGHAIFVAAVIRHVETIDSGNLFRRLLLSQEGRRSAAAARRLRSGHRAAVRPWAYPCHITPCAATPRANLVFFPEHA